jgi:hypothetical protein
MQRSGAKLVFHGIALILLGSAAGFAYLGVLTGELASGAQAWRFAHLNGLVNGAILVAIGGSSPHLTLSPTGERWLLLLTIGGSYSNVGASIVGAALGQRGLDAVGPATNLLVFGLFAIAVVALLSGLVVALVGARRSLSRRSH